MALKGILAISGKPGLYKHIAQAKNSIIVESIENGKRMPAYASSKISALEDIAIFTDESEIQLVEIFNRIKEGEILKDAKNPKKMSADEIKDHFEEVVPNYDKDRVYVSDMKKVLTWYLFLEKNDALDLSEEKEKNKEDTKDEEDKE